MFAAVNMLSVYLLLFPVAPLTPAAIVVAYVLLAVVQDGCLRRGRSTLLPFTVPIVALAMEKAIPAVVDPSFELPRPRPLLPVIAALISISCFAFRTSYLALGVRMA